MVCAVISHSLWDDLAGDEVVARSLFSSSSSLTDLTSGLEKSGIFNTWIRFMTLNPRSYIVIKDFMDHNSV